MMMAKLKRMLQRHRFNNRLEASFLKDRLIVRILLLLVRMIRRRKINNEQQRATTKSFDFFQLGWHRK